VLQDELEHEEQPLPDALIRLAPPPMPKAEMSFRTSAPPQCGQRTSGSPLMRTRDSNRWRQAEQQNS
jgi:hypothetical protein